MPMSCQTLIRFAFRPVGHAGLWHSHRMPGTTSRLSGASRLRPVCAALGLVLAASLALTAVGGRQTAVAVSRSALVSPGLPTLDEVGFDYPGGDNPYVSIHADESGVIESTQPGSLLVVSVFRISDTALAQELLDAADRGVHVEVLLNGGNGCVRGGGCRTVPVTLLKKLNHLTPSDPLSWLRTCDGGTPVNGDVTTSSGRGCIGQGLDHNKFIAASSVSLPGAGPPSTMVVQTSTNNTTGQYDHAWNDAMLLYGQPALYRDYLRYFRQMVTASTSKAPTSTVTFTPRRGTRIDTTTIGEHDIETWSFPRRPADDPVAQVLARIPTAHRCRNTVSTGATGPAQTQIYAAVAFISGRPLLMRQLLTLQDAGCSVQIIYATISAHDRQQLISSGVQLYQACTPADTADNQTAEFLHSKFFLVNGSDTTVGHNRRIVYTGSENWNDQSLTNADNRMLRYVDTSQQDLPGPITADSGIYAYYLARWAAIAHQVLTNGQPATTTCTNASDY
jgi:phosphatidylserine/phosphatidylglycerophosphate/cardiolipin synthase-like enzyme